MLISQPIDIAGSPCVVRMGSEAVDSHHAEQSVIQQLITSMKGAAIWTCILHERSKLTGVTWRTIQKLESKPDRWLRSLFIIRALPTTDHTWPRPTMLTSYHRVA